MSEEKQQPKCPFCHKELPFLPPSASLFCPFCNSSLTAHPSCLQRTEFLPLPEKIGHFEVLSRIGMGGMGEVFKAFDPHYKRTVAIKRIRSDRTSSPSLHKRFLQEARLTATLTHPGIIAIYAIYQEDAPYFVMPYIEGKSLKQILKEAINAKKTRKYSISALLPIFLSTCQAIAYAHQRGVLHRDIKPENILIGTYGQILIVDWGLIKAIHDEEESQEAPDWEEESHTTLPGKVVGTLAYMAPERAFKKPATKQTDIYSLGVLLYQILCLHLPFHRTTLSHFRSTYKTEKLLDPSALAPHRDIPPALTNIAYRCLDFDCQMRYATIDDLISDIEDFNQGHSHWMLLSHLDMQKRSDWEVADNILVPLQLAIAGKTVMTDWLGLLISSASFSGNTALQIKVRFAKSSRGIGLLLNVPEKQDRHFPTDGFCLWLSLQKETPTRLFRSGVEVLELPDVHVSFDSWHTLRLEKVDHHICFYLNEECVGTYISHLPLAGPHVGILYYETAFEVEKMQVYVKSADLHISCLAVPDAFLTSKIYDRALAEYRRIAYAFKGRSESRQALFRAGITLLMQAESSKRENLLFDAALEEFGKLKDSSGAPLEYLGKALVYEALNEPKEEVKCFELALRKYPHHPLLCFLSDQIAYRLHRSSWQDRKSAYGFAYLLMHYLPHVISNPDHVRLLKRIQRASDPLPFLDHREEDLSQLLLSLSFWMRKPYALIETALRCNEEDGDCISQIMACLVEMEAFEATRYLLETLKEKNLYKPLAQYLQLIAFNDNNELPPLDYRPEYLRLYFIHMMQSRKMGRYERLKSLIQSLNKRLIPAHFTIWLAELELECYLMTNDLSRAQKVAESSPLLCYLRCCLLAASNQVQKARQSLQEFQTLTHPCIGNLANFYLQAGEIEQKNFLQHAFWWEIQQLACQLKVWHHCTKCAFPPLPPMEQYE